MGEQPVATREAVRFEASEVFRGRTAVLGAAHLRARFSEVTAILGPNGAGKTTLLMAAAGLSRYRGRLEWGGEDVHTMDALEKAQAVAFVPQQSELASAFAVEEVVSQGGFAMQSLGGRDRSGLYARVEMALERTDTAHLRHRVFTTLSGGERRRVLIARAIASGAKILLLDEPTAGLDVRHRLALHALLLELAAAGYAIVAVLHDLEDAFRDTHAVWLMKDRAVVASGPTAQVLTDDAIESVYGVTVLPGQARGFALTVSEGSGE